MRKSRLLNAVMADDVEAMALAIAADEDPSGSAHAMRRLDDLAAELATAVLEVDGHRRLGRLVHGMYRRLRFRTPESYDDPRLHLVDHVVLRRSGSPVALAVVLIALGRRLGVELSGVAFPGHFMVRYEASQPVFIDPSSGAFPFPADSLQALAADELRVSLSKADRFLLPVGARTIGVRLLQNLQRAYEERGDIGRAMLVLDRLYELTGSPAARCDRGLRAAALGAAHFAVDDLSAYLRDHPDDRVARTMAALAPTRADLN